MVSCKDQDEVDYYWDRLGRRWRRVAVRLAQGPVRAELADRADRLFELVNDPDRARAAAATKAMLGMRKIVIAELEDAAQNA